MRQLFIKLGILVGIVVVTIFIYLLMVPIQSNGFFDSFEDRLTLIDNSDNHIVIIGGSNVAYSVDCEEIESVYTDYRVVNMGLSAGMGLKAIIKMILPVLDEGDILLIIPEYEHFYTTLDGGSKLIDYLTYYPEYIMDLDVYQIGEIIVNLPSFIRKTSLVAATRWINQSEPVGKSYLFSKNYDLIGHLDQPSIDIGDESLFDGEVVEMNKRAISFLGKISTDLEQLNIVTLISFPAIPDNQYHEYKEQITEVEDVLILDFGDRVISDPRDYLYEESLFFDTIYHLGREGREIRTEQLIEDIGEYLD